MEQENLSDNVVKDILNPPASPVQNLVFQSFFLVSKICTTPYQSIKNKEEEKKIIFRHCSFIA